MKYGFHCKHCGYTKNSDNKEEVQAVKRSHKPRAAFGGGCTFTNTDRGTIARPSLAEAIKNENRRSLEAVRIGNGKGRRAA